MPDFVATLLAAAVFCLGLIGLNALTRFALQWPMAPADLAENGLLQYGLALVAAGMAWRGTTRERVTRTVHPSVPR